MVKGHARDRFTFVSNGSYGVEGDRKYYKDARRRIKEWLGLIKCFLSQMRV